MRSYRHWFAALLLIGAGPLVAAPLPTEAAQDADAHRGRLAEIPGGVIRDDAGRIVWDRRDFAFLDAADASATVNPALWRQARRNAAHGLFEIVPGAMWQVRGYDISVMTIIRGRTGWIVIDPLTVTETARASFDLVRRVLGERPVSAIIFTHPHVDHFGGVLGIVSREDIERRRIPVIAPAGFTEEVWRENLLAGPAMQKRAAYMFGTGLKADAAGFIDNGIGPALPAGTSNHVEPTRSIGPDDRQVQIDGVNFTFIDVSGTEAPVEFAFHLPDWGVIHTAEVATTTLHHLLTLRGAQVRDSLLWSQSLDRIHQLCTRVRCDIRIASHGWPTFGQERVLSFLAAQRDVYRFIHDQALGAANEGQTMHEIAANFSRDQGIADPLAAGFYGDLKNNARAVYQRYFGWWDGVPAHLDPLPPAELAAHYVALGGGADATLAKARQALASGDRRWAAQLLNHLVFSGAGEEARLLLATVYDELAAQALSAAVRNSYLTAALELRSGQPPAAISGGRPAAAFLASIPLAAHLDFLATRYRRQEADAPVLLVRLTATDRQETALVEARPLAAIVRDAPENAAADAGIRAEKPVLLALLAGQLPLDEAVADGRADVAGDAAAIRQWLGRHRPMPGSFHIALP